MSKKHTVYSERFVIKLHKKKSQKRLVNIQVIYKDKQFFEYKITFEGLPRGVYRFFKGVVIDSVKGVRKTKQPIFLKGPLEISYHFNGNVTYKDAGGIGNIHPMVKFPSVAEIGKPVCFLKVIGFTFNVLGSINNRIKSRKRLITLKNFSTNSFITCEFFLSSAISPKGIPYGIRPHKRTNKFKNFQSFPFNHKEMNLDLYINFYKADTKGVYIHIPPRGLLKTIRNRFWYFIFWFYDKIKK